ncbi:transposase [Labrenzia sp. EL_126]|nr:transposase [Labrenzia sp. EL_126]
MEDYSAFVGLDAHKDTVAVVIAEAGRLGEVRFRGTVANEEVRIASLVKKLSRQHGCILVAYEAGACGYSIHRQITGLGHDCVVVAPSRVPKKSADRIKNDRRDALTLARLLRAVELSPIWVPDTAHEAMRDLIRARHVAARDLQKTRQTIQSFMLRQDRRFDGRPWTKGHLRWLRRQSFAQPAQFIALESYLDSAERAVMRCDHLETEIKSQLRNWSLREQVSALQSFRGIALTTTVTLVAEIGDIQRFATPRALMAYIGLVPNGLIPTLGALV